MLPVTMTAGYYLVEVNLRLGNYFLVCLAASLMTPDGDRLRPGLQKMVFAGPAGGGALKSSADCTLRKAVLYFR